MHAPFDDRQALEPGEIRAALDRICASRPFKHAPKLSRFLRFVVETALSGQAARLKGYTIAVEALGRGEDFDPQVDPIVRVEANRLRAALARYYAGAGARDPIVIEVPRGRYAPQFHRREVRPGEDAPRLLRMIRKMSRFLQVRFTLQMPPDPR